MYNLSASVKSLSAPPISKRFGAIPPGQIFTNALPPELLVRGSTPKFSPKALCSVPLNKTVLVPSASDGHSVYIRCPQNKSVRKKVLGHNSTSFDRLGTDCQLPGALPSACVVLLSFQALPILWKLTRCFPDDTSAWLAWRGDRDRGQVLACGRNRDRRTRREQSTRLMGGVRNRRDGRSIHGPSLDINIVLSKQETREGIDTGPWPGRKNAARENGIYISGATETVGRECIRGAPIV